MAKVAKSKRHSLARWTAGDPLVADAAASMLCFASWVM
jgi:hypothetical protein